LARQIFAGLPLVTFLPVAAQHLLQIAQGSGRSPLHTDCGHPLQKTPNAFGAVNIALLLQIRKEKPRHFFIFLAGTRAFKLFRAHFPPVAARLKNLQKLPSLISRRRLTLSRAF
jgi:hypothetical protein